MQVGYDGATNRAGFFDASGNFNAGYSYATDKFEAPHSFKVTVDNLGFECSRGTMLYDASATLSALGCGVGITRWQLFIGGALFVNADTVAGTLGMPFAAATHPALTRTNTGFRTQPNNGPTICDAGKAPGTARGTITTGAGGDGSATFGFDVGVNPRGQVTAINAASPAFAQISALTSTTINVLAYIWNGSAMVPSAMEVHYAVMSESPISS
jgi:hypothetical protein